MTEAEDKEIRAFLAGQQITFEAANRLWRALKAADEVALARQVLARLREPKTLSDRIPAEIKGTLAAQEAELTSKDPELSAALRHDQAIDILRDYFGDLGNGGKPLRWRARAARRRGRI